MAVRGASGDPDAESLRDYFRRRLQHRGIRGANEELDDEEVAAGEAPLVACVAQRPCPRYKGLGRDPIVALRENLLNRPTLWLHPDFRRSD